MTTQEPLQFQCDRTYRGYGYMVLNADVINYQIATQMCGRYGATLPYQNMKSVKYRR